MLALTIRKATHNHTLDQVKIEWTEDTVVTVVLAHGGYPDDYTKGKVSTGTDAHIDSIDTAMVLENGELKTSGGRVLAVTGLSSDLKAAQEKAYQAVELIHFEGMHYRKDIAAKAFRG